MPVIEAAVMYRVTLTREEMRTIMSALVARATQESTDLHQALRAHTQLAVTDWATQNGVRLVRPVSRTAKKKAQKAQPEPKSGAKKAPARA